MPVTLQEPQSTNTLTKGLFNLSIEIVETPIYGEGEELPRQKRAKELRRSAYTLTASWKFDHFPTFDQAGISPSPDSIQIVPSALVTVTWTYFTTGGHNRVTYRIPGMKGHCTLPSARKLVVNFALSGGQTEKYTHMCNAPSSDDPYDGRSKRRAKKKRASGRKKLTARRK
jgi:hypothetical protein